MTVQADPPQALPRAVPPSRSDGIAARASRMIGGAWGRYAGVGTRAWWTPTRFVMALAGITLLLAFAQKSPCTTGDWVGYKQYTHACYSDVVPLWIDERLESWAAGSNEHAQGAESAVDSGRRVESVGKRDRGGAQLDGGSGEKPGAARATIGAEQGPPASAPLETLGNRGSRAGSSTATTHAERGRHQPPAPAVSASAACVSDERRRISH